MRGYWYDKPSRLAPFLSGTFAILGCCRPFASADRGEKEQEALLPPPPASGHRLPYQLLTIDNKDVPSSLSLPRTDGSSFGTHGNGTVSPDISREVPVISLANGRVVEIRARLDENVKKGQLLFQRTERRRDQCLQCVFESCE